MTHESLVDDGWPETIELLGGEQVIAESARDTRAFMRPRGIRSASDLLRLTLAYSLGKVGMRAIVAWAVARGIADISDVALLGRLRNTGPWLQKLICRLLKSEEALDLIGHLKNSKDEIIECPVWLGCRTGQPLKMRLIALRKSDAAANETRRKLNKEAKAKGRQVREETLIAAGFVILVTSLPQDEFSPDAILKLYRMRCRI